jgi:energy-coupling factor transporter ATP-binding protein EcfA2
MRRSDGLTGEMVTVVENPKETRDSNTLPSMVGVSIGRVIVRNYRALAHTNISLRPDLNIIVGDNESGKSTLLEAINLALKCQINRRSAAYELHPYLFNTKCVAKFLKDLKSQKHVPPPEILIELYLNDIPELADLKGTNNSLFEDCPGISLRIALDDNLRVEYQDYIADPAALTTIPIEYYSVFWQSFAGEILNSRSVPFRSSLVDPGAISNTYAANKYVIEFTRDYLTKEQQVHLALSYRNLRHTFDNDDAVAKINSGLL